MNEENLRRSLARLEAWLLAERTPAGVLARRQGGVAAPADATLVAGWCATLVAGHGPDGSWKGSIARTAAALVRLRELGCEGASMEPAAKAALDWLRTQAGRPGRFGDGCTPAAHGVGLCHHFAAGFYAPGPGDPVQEGPPLAGAGPGAEQALVLSSAALRAVLVWGGTGTAVQLHIEALRRILSIWAAPEGEPVFSAHAAHAVLAALLEAAGTERNVEAVAQGLTALARTQRGEGTWAGVDPFESMALLMRAVERGYAAPEMERSIERVAGLLTVSQRSDGRWGDEDDMRALAGWRGLRHVLRRAGGAGRAAREEPA